MNNFFSLVKNELIKIYIMKWVWIMYFFMILIVLGSLIFNTLTSTLVNQHDYTDNWRLELKEETEILVNENKNEEDELTIMLNNVVIDENNYYMENNLRPYGYHAGNFIIDNLFLTSFVSLMTIIVAGGIVANEFTWGTIKQILIRPFTRGTILSSKYIAVIIFAIISVALLIISNFIIGMISYGLPLINPEIIVNRPDGLSSNTISKEIFLQYILKLVNIIILGTFAFMISTIFRNSSLAIALSIFFMFIGTSVSKFLGDYTWSKFIIFSHTDLSVYFSPFGPVQNENTLEFSIVIIFVYMIIFILCTWVIFNKRDI